MEVWQRESRSKQIYQQKSCVSSIVKRRMQWSERDFHMLWLAREGKSPREIAELLGYTARWVRTIIQRWNTQGEEGIRDQRHDIVGGPALLSPEQQEELRAALREPPADGGLWSGPKVAQWMQKRLERKVAPQRGWEYLQRLNYSSHVPRPEHAKADEATRQEFKKNSPNRSQ